MAPKKDRKTAQPPLRRVTRSMTKEQIAASEPETQSQNKNTKSVGRRTAKDGTQGLTGPTKGKKSKATPAKKAAVLKKVTGPDAKLSKPEQNDKASQKLPAIRKSKRHEPDISDDEPVAAESEPAKSVKDGRLRKPKVQKLTNGSDISSHQVGKSNSKKRNGEAVGGEPRAKRSKTSKSPQPITSDVGSKAEAKSKPRNSFPPVPSEKHKNWMEKFNHNHEHYQEELKKLKGRPKWPLSKTKNDVMNKAIFKAIGAVWRASWTSGEQYGLAIPSEMAPALKGSQLKLNAIPGQCYELILPLRLKNSKGDSVLVKVEARTRVTEEEALEVILTLYDSEIEKKSNEHGELFAKAEQIVEHCGWWVLEDQEKDAAASKYSFTHEIIEVPKDSNMHSTMATVFYAWTIMLNLSPMKTTTAGDATDREKQAGVVARQVLNCVLAGTYDLATIEAFLIAYKYVEEPPMKQSLANHTNSIIYLKDGCATGFVKGIVPDDWQVALDQEPLVNGNASGAGSRGSNTESETVHEDHEPANGNHVGSNPTDPGPNPAFPVSFRRRRLTKLRTAKPGQLRRNEWQEIYQSWRKQNAASLSAWAAKPSRSVLPAHEQLYEEHVFGGIGALWAGLWHKGRVYGFGRSDTFQLLREQEQSPSEFDRLTCGATRQIPEGSITLILPLVGYGPEFSVHGLEEVPSPVRKTRNEKYRQRPDGHWILAVAERPSITENAVTLKIYDSLAG